MKRALQSACYRERAKDRHTTMLQEGDRVMHSTSGRGVILECSGMRARVQYDDGAVSWVELKDLTAAPRIKVHNGVDLDAAYALLQQQLGATPACSRHPHESRWVLVEEEIDEMHSDSSNPQHEAGVVYYVYDLGGFEGKLFSAVWSFRNTRWYSRGGSSGFGNTGVAWAEGAEAAAILWSGERIECTKLRDHRFGRG